MILPSAINFLRGWRSLWLFYPIYTFFFTTTWQDEVHSQNSLRSPRFFIAETNNPQIEVTERRVFLVSIPFQRYFSFSGTPIIHNGTQAGLWPLLSDNVHILRYWLLCVIDDTNNEPPTQDQLLAAHYFDHPQQPLIRTGPRNYLNRTPNLMLPRTNVETMTQSRILEGLRTPLMKLEPAVSIELSHISKS